MEHPPDNNSGTSSKQNLKKWPPRSHLWLILFTIHTFVPCPQFFCLLKPIPNVYTPRSLGFSFSLWTACLTLPPKAKPPFLHTCGHSKPCPKNAVFMSMLLLCQPVQDCSWCCSETSGIRCQSLTTNNAELGTVIFLG
jgi:hypothetical protein